jgi:hypothetical protein
LTQFALPRGAARAFEIGDQVFAPPIVLALHPVTVVPVDLAIVAVEAFLARASKRILTFHANATIETRRRGTFQHVRVAELATPTWITRALVETETINAVPIGTIMVQAIVRVGLAVLALPSERAAAFVVVHQVHAFTAIDAGGAVERALVDINLTIRTLPAWETDTNIGCDAILARAAVATGRQSTLVDLLLAMFSSETFPTSA